MEQQMSAATAALDRMLEPFGHCLNVEAARRIVEMQTDPLVKERVEVLAERANEGLLTEEERAEYKTYVDVDDVLTIIKLKAQRFLTEHGDA
jgi:hypothetical protein